MKNNIEEIDRYLQNEMSESEKLSFEARLESDPDLKQEFNILIDAKESLTNNWKLEKAEHQLKANLERIGQDYFKAHAANSEPSPLNRIRPLVFGWIKYAALLIVAIGGYWWWQSSQTTTDSNLFAEYSTVNTISLTEKGSDNSQLTNAEDAFNAKNYPEAIQLFDQILQADSSQIEIKFYKAIALIETNECTKARLLLSELSKASSVFKEDAEWYTILSYVREKNNSEATKLIKALPTGHSYESKARELLNKF